MIILTLVTFISERANRQINKEELKYRLEEYGKVNSKELTVQ